MKKVLIIIPSVILMLILGFTFKASSQGEISISRHMKNNKTLYLEIEAPVDMQEVILEILNDKEEVTHFFILDKPVIKQSPKGTRNNYFYITRNMAQFRQFNKIKLYSKNLRERIFIMKEIETNIVEADTVLMASSNNDLMVSNNNDEERIRVMTYNIHHGKSLFGVHSIDAISEIIADNDLDIVGLQEVDNGMLRSRFRNQAEYLGLKLDMNYAFGENINILGGKYGNAILSRHPIIEYENYSLPSGREQRGFLRATIDVNGKHLQFIVTHLGLNDEERATQLEIIKRHIETLQQEVILVGDFNALQESPEIRSISKILQDSGDLTGKYELPTFDLPLLSKRIDYIFVGQGFRIDDYEVIKSRSSDHYPVKVELVLPR